MPRDGMPGDFSSRARRTQGRVPRGAAHATAGRNAPRLAVAASRSEVEIDAGDTVATGLDAADDVSAVHADSMRAVAEPRPASRRRTSKAAPEKSIQSVEVRPTSGIVNRGRLERRPAIIHLPIHPVAPQKPPSWMLEECQVSPARAGDQSEIIQLLSGLPVAPTKAEFHASVDHPDHDPGNRLVARLAGRIVGHVEIVPRTVMLGSEGPSNGGQTVSAAVIDRVAVLPECRGAGHGQRLVRAAEERMRQIGAAVAFSRTRIAPSFHDMGWAVLGRDCATPGRPAEILARLLERPVPMARSSAGAATVASPAAARPAEAVTMRQWRHVELPAILRIYRQNAARFVGPLDRGESYSRWLVSRGAFDSIIVALVGQDRYDLHETTARIVGYCIQSGNRVLELLADPEFPGLERDILARVCAEAIENDRQEIVFESSVADPLHRAVAGGESLVQPQDRMIVAKMLRPFDVLQAAAPATVARVAAAGIRETVELGIDSPCFRGSVIVADGKASVHPGRVGRSYLRLADDELARLLLGQCDPVVAVARGTMEPSTQMAQKLAGVLFPRLPLWCPVWDDMPA